jgi:hypothetical protein
VIIRVAVIYVRKHGHAISLLPSADGFFCRFREGGMKVEEKEGQIGVSSRVQVNGVSQISMTTRGHFSSLCVNLIWTRLEKSMELLFIPCSLFPLCILYFKNI